MPNPPKKPNNPYVTLAKLDPTKAQMYQLPSDILADLQDAFQHYDKQQEGMISVAHFRNILHNFGFHRLSKKEIDEELKKADPDFLKKSAVEFDMVKFVVGYRWHKGSGNMDEARECFKLFDKRDKDSINAGDLK